MISWSCLDAKVSMLTEVGNQPTSTENVQHDARHGARRNAFAGANIAHNQKLFTATLVGDDKAITFADPPRIARYRQQAVVDGVAVISARKALGYHRVNTRAQDNRDRHLHGRAT